KLLECGVDSNCIEVIADEQESTSKALRMACPGDLILILADNVKRSWKQIIYFNSEAKADDSAKKSVASIDLPETDGFSFDDDMEIISDERGVRIAKEAGD
ncbi:MAG: cyanophycin synthetase, partial [Woeseiaceae bacterium]